MLAHMTQETGGQSQWDADNKNCPIFRQTFANVEETKCVNDITKCGEYDKACDNKITSKLLPCGTNKHYYGRGPFQLSHSYNYGPFSYIMTGSIRTYLDAPELLATDGQVSMLSAFYFYMTPQSPKPSMHEVAVGFYEPNTSDKKAKLEKGFGVTINIINGEKECRSTSPAENKKKAVNRKDMLKKWLEHFGIGDNAYGKENTSCENMSEFGENGWASRTLYWMKYSKWSNSCKLTKDSSSIWPIQLGDGKKDCDAWVYNL